MNLYSLTSYCLIIVGVSFFYWISRDVFAYRSEMRQEKVKSDLKFKTIVIKTLLKSIIISVSFLSSAMLCSKENIPNFDDIFLYASCIFGTIFFPFILIFFNVKIYYEKGVDDILE